MVSKKYTVLIALLLTFGVSAFAQTSGWDWKDSSVVPVKSITQYNEFKQNKNPFPPKPRNAWELGVSIGHACIAGDTKPGLGFGGSLTLRKAITNTLSFRVGYFGSLNNGNETEHTTYLTSGSQTLQTYVNVPNTAGTATTALPVQTAVGYKAAKFFNKTHAIGFDLINSINTFSNYRGDPTVNVYALGGIDVLASQVKINGKYWNRNINMDGLLPLSKEGSKVSWLLCYSFGGGAAWKLNNKMNIGVEERITKPFSKYALLDGFDSGTADTYFYTAFKLNYNLF